MAPWVLLDLFLFCRVWRGGRRARGVLIFLTLLAAALGGFALIAELFDDSISAGMGWPGVLCALGSLLCLLAPALDPDQRPFERTRGLRTRL